MANAEITSPDAVFRHGSVSAAVYRKQQTTKDGKSFETFNVSLRRSYRNAKGSWEQTHNLRGEDLLHASFALTKCYDFVSSVKQTDEDAA